MIIDLLKHMRLRKKTKDGQNTLEELRNRVKYMVHKVNTTNDSDEEITQFIMDSFAQDMVEIYNELGYYEWLRLMAMVVSYEIEQRLEVES